MAPDTVRVTGRPMSAPYSRLRFWMYSTVIAPTPEPVLVFVTTMRTSLVPTSKKAAVRVASVPGVTPTLPIVPPATAPAAVNAVASAEVPTPVVVAPPVQAVVTDRVMRRIWLLAGMTMLVGVVVAACVMAANCARTT